MTWWILLAFLTACSTTPTPTEDQERITRIEAMVEALREAYERRRPDQVEAILPTPWVADHPERAADLRRHLVAYEHLTVEFLIERMVLDGPRTDVVLHWVLEGRRGDVGPVRERGDGLLVFDGTETMTLQDVKGTLPFLSPGAGGP